MRERLHGIFGERVRRPQRGRVGRERPGARTQPPVLHVHLLAVGRTSVIVTWMSVSGAVDFSQRSTLEFPMIAASFASGAVS